MDPMQMIRNRVDNIERSEPVTADYTKPIAKQATAIRGSALLHVDEEMVTAAEEAQNAQNQTPDPETIELQRMASLAEHPGWQIVRQKAEIRINAYRSGAALAEYLAKPDITDEQIGAMARLFNILAGEYTQFINEVEMAALEVHRQQEEARNAPVRERVAGRT